MSPERPPSVDSGGSMLDNTSITAGSGIESGHIIVQQSSQQHGQHTIGNSNYVTTYGTIQSSMAAVAAIQSTPSISSSSSSILESSSSSNKLLVLQPNQLNENYITTPESNGIGNIVLLATEQMDIGTLGQNGIENNNNINNNNHSTDEELTSLTWLHDKNLLKGKLSQGINLTCTGTKSFTNSPGRLGTGAISPTSDYVDDSCVSEDNVSSANSCSDQGIETLSTNNNNNNNNYQHHYAINNNNNNTSNNNSINNSTNNNHNNNNNNNIINKNRNHITLHTSPSSSSASLSIVGGSATIATATSLPPGIIYVASDGSIIDSKTITTSSQQRGRLLQQPQHISSLVPQLGSVTMTPSPLGAIGTTVITSTAITSTTANQTVAPTAQSIIQTSTSSTTPHQHFHKKYLREEHNKTLKEAAAIVPDTSIIKLETDSSIKYATDSTEDYANSDNNNYALDTELNIVTNFEANSHSRQASPKTTQQQQQQKLKHPNNLPYDPLIHTANKPPLSFSSLIYLAIEDSHEKALPVKEIYAWIVAHYPYFKTAPTGWKNSVRHNLSLNKCFQKVEKAPNMGKGSLWRVEQQYKPNLIQALTRSSYHPCASTVDKGAFKSSDSPPCLKANGRQLDADLFPRLSKCMAEITNINNNHNNSSNNLMALDDDDELYQRVRIQQQQQQQQAHTNFVYVNGDNGDGVTTTINISNASPIMSSARDWSADSIDDVNAATAMLALKHGPKVFTENYHNGTSPVITSSPSEDHTYSAGGIGSKRSSNNSDNNSNSTSSDAAYESSEESQHNQISREELEARRHAEGVDAFLTFATEVSTMSSPIKRPPSPDSSVYIENGSIHFSSPQHSSVATHNIHQQQTPFIPYSFLSSPSPPKKSRSRTLRTKLKKKTWFR